MGKFPNPLRKYDFVVVGRWHLTGDELQVKWDRGYVDTRAIYSFVHRGKVKYIGICQGKRRTLDMRFAEYRKKEKPVEGRRISQNMRVKSEITKVLRARNAVYIYAMVPPSGFSYKNLDIDLVTGLEHSLIEKFCPPWNNSGRE